MRIKALIIFYMLAVTAVIIGSALMCVWETQEVKSVPVVSTFDGQREVVWQDR